MKKYLAICVLFMESIIVMAMDIEIPTINKQQKKREKVSRVIILKRSQPIDIAGSGEFTIEAQEQRQEWQEKSKFANFYFSSGGSWMSIQSCSPSFSDYQK